MATIKLLLTGSALDGYDVPTFDAALDPTLTLAGFGAAVKAERGICVIRNASYAAAYLDMFRECCLVCAYRSSDLDATAAAQLALVAAELGLTFISDAELVDFMNPAAPDSREVNLDMPEVVLDDETGLEVSSDGAL